jgi:exodeoxyribonuclease VII large subunit
MSLFDLPFEEPFDSAQGKSRDSAQGKHETEPKPAAPRPRERRVHTVSQLTARIRTLLEEELFEIWVEGELSNCKIWNNGHLYFTLKDRHAQIRGVIFQSSLRRLKFTPKDGISVVARGRVSVYDKKGEYELVCEHMDPAGLGALQLAYDQLKQRLEAEGLFDVRRKRALPALPRKIGVVTSLEGAAIRDIIKVLRRRYANAHVVIRPVRVQGQGAALDIARGLAAIAKVKGVDVVIVGRGGGSIEDLWAFNEEVAARAIAGCPVPIISAVGHETDVTIADFVADLRAPTPSAAAEMVVARKDEFVSRIDGMASRLNGSMQTRLHRVESRLRTLEARSGVSGARGRLAMCARQAGELTHELRRAMRARLAARERGYQTLRLALETFDLRRRLAGLRTRLVSSDGRLASVRDRRRHALDARLGAAVARLDSLSPLAVLARGYAVCWNGDRTQVIRDASRVALGERVTVTIERGELGCEVKERRNA